MMKTHPNAMVHIFAIEIEIEIEGLIHKDHAQRRESFFPISIAISISIAQMKPGQIKPEKCPTNPCPETLPGGHQGNRNKDRKSKRIACDEGVEVGGRTTAAENG
ncbi:hypothetical protein [Desulfonatronum parangueonense]